MAYNDEFVLDQMRYKIALLREFLQKQTQNYREDSKSEWVQGNHSAYHITLELLNTFFKEDK